MRFQKTSSLHSWDRASLMYLSITNKMQRYTIFITINALHVSGGSSAHHQELKTVYTASSICRAFTASYRLCEWVGTAQSQLTHDSSTRFTCTAFIVINTRIIVYRCILLVTLKYILEDITQSEWVPWNHKHSRP